MKCKVTVWNTDGVLLRSLGQFGNIASARQAMLDDSNIVDLPNGEPLFLPAIGVLEGWFVDRTEYVIEAA